MGTSEASKPPAGGIVPACEKVVSGRRQGVVTTSYYYDYKI